MSIVWTLTPVAPVTRSTAVRIFAGRDQMRELRAGEFGGFGLERIEQLGQARDDVVVMRDPVAVVDIRHHARQIEPSRGAVRLAGGHDLAAAQDRRGVLDDQVAPAARAQHRPVHHHLFAVTQRDPQRHRIRSRVR